jgi:hypothetical protein
MPFSIRLWFTKLLVYTTVVAGYLILITYYQGADINWLFSLILNSFAVNASLMMFEGVLNVIGMFLMLRYPDRANLLRIPALFIYSIFYSTLVITYNLQFYDLSSEIMLFTIGVVLLFSLHFILDSGLNEEHLDSPFTLLLWWFVAGSASGALLTLVGIVILAYLGIVVESMALLFLTAVLTGGISAGVSVLGRYERVSPTPSYITTYSMLLASFKNHQSHFLDEITDLGNHDNEPIDYIDARELLEDHIPGGMTSLAVASFFVLITGMSLYSQSRLGEFDFVSDTFLIIMSGVLVIVFVMFLKNALKVYRQYQNWRSIWSRLWNIVKLFSMGQDSTILETAYIESYDYKRNPLMFEEDKESFIRGIMEKYGMVETIPKNETDMNRLLINAILYDSCKLALENASEISKSLEDELGLLKKAQMLLSQIKLLSAPDSRAVITQALFYSGVVDYADLPRTILMDLRPLFKRGLTKNDDLLEMSLSQLESIEATPKRALPDSLKWMPAIYAVSLWIVSIFLG